MSEKTVTLKLNQQQLGLLDRTIAQGVAPDRVALVHLALREYAARHGQESARQSARQSAKETVKQTANDKASS